MTADELPTVQIDDGVVWTQAVVGDTVYAGGSFSQTRPPGAARGTQLTPRANLLAYDIRTGALLPFAPQINGQVKVVRSSPDGKRLYVGGAFSQVDGKARWNLAVFDTATGVLLDDFKPTIGGSFVSAIAVTDANVYVGGLFTQAAGAARTNLAAFTLAGGLTAWAPTTDRQVDAMVVAPAKDKVVIGGRFGKVNGVAQLGMAALDLTTGARLTWNVVKTVKNGNSNNSGISDVDTDGTTIYATAWNFEGPGNMEGVFAVEPKAGDIVWVGNGNGDTYGVYANGSAVYSAGHAHDLSPIGGFPNNVTPSGIFQFSIALTTAAKGHVGAGGRWSYQGQPAPALIHWYPKWITGKFTGMGQAGWTVEGNADYLVFGGEFQGVNGSAQYGLTRFARPGIAPSKVGPRFTPTGTAPDVWGDSPSYTAMAGGGQITIRPNYDRDDRKLTYELYRSGTATPVARAVVESSPWTRASQSLLLRDTSAAASTTYTYQVKVTDPDGNSQLSIPMSRKTGTGTLARPTPAFTQSVKGRAVTLDGRSTTVPTGRTVKSYEWDFGDNTSATGAQATHTYAKPGTYTVALWVTDSTGISSSTTQTVTIAAPVLKPTAAIRATEQGMTVNLDGTGSTVDPTAKVSGYEWDFGDGTTGTGATVARTYAAPGTYTVKLTVTDTNKATATATTTVTVSTQAPVGPLAADAFERQGTGWGPADVGGAWTADKGLTTEAGRGIVPLPAGQTRSAYLTGVTVLDVDMTLDVALDKPAEGGSTMVSALVRRTGAGDYRVKTTFNTDGTVAVNLIRVVGGTETLIKNAILPGYAYTPGESLRIRLRATRAAGSTTLSVKAWKADGVEPAAWFLTAADAQAELQAPGHVGVSAYLSGKAANAPQTVRIDNLTVATP